MTAVQRLEALLARVQRNRGGPRHLPYDDDADADTPTLSPPPPDPMAGATAKRAKTSPLEEAINDAAAPPEPRKKPTLPRQSAAAAAAPEPAPRAAPAPAAAAIAARPVHAAPLAPSSATPVKTTGDAVVVEESTFGDLLSRSLSLRTR